jgi:hypothetical protein
LKAVQQGVFQNCFVLRTIHIPSRLVKLFDSVFSGSDVNYCSLDLSNPLFLSNKCPLVSCDGSRLIPTFDHVAELRIPQSVQIIDESCFSDASWLVEVSAQNGSQLREIRRSAFEKCSALRKVSLPNTVEMLGPSSFSDCRQLCDFSIETRSQLRRIEKQAFYHCHSLKFFTLPDSVEILGTECFRWCRALIKIHIHTTSSLKTIGDHAFMHCSSLSSLFLPKHVESVSADVLVRSGVQVIQIDGANKSFFFENRFLLNKSRTLLIRDLHPDGQIAIPDSVEVIGEKCFAGCESVTGLRVGAGSALREIRTAAFSECSGLVRFSLPSTVEILGPSCYLLCWKLFEFAFESPAQLRLIDTRAFHSCSQLARVTIPASVEVLGDSCFSLCSALLSIRFEPNSSLKTIGKHAFDRCSRLTEFTLPRSTEAICEGAFLDCKSLSHFTVETPSSLQRIECCAFRGCSALTTFDIPPSIIFIGSWAFPENCDVQVPDHRFESPFGYWRLKLLISRGAVLDAAHPIPVRDCQLSLDEWDQAKTIRAGSRGRMHRYVHKQSGNVIAVKEYDVPVDQEINSGDQKEFLREVE